MGRACRSGPMAPSTKACGSVGRPRARGNSPMWMGTPTMDSGRTTKPMDTGCSCIRRQVPNTRGTGRTTCSMDQVCKHIPMANMKACLRKANATGRVSTT